jgi:hypothetical protein
MTRLSRSLGTNGQRLPINWFALGSAIVATLRGSRFWLTAVFLAGWFSLASFMSEL